MEEISKKLNEIFIAYEHFENKIDDEAEVSIFNVNY